MSCRIFLFFKMVLNVRFEASEIYFHKNVYTPDVIEDKGKKAIF